MTLIAISVIVADGAEGSERTVLTRVRSRAHAGHRMPTGVGVMQSGQMALPQDEQATPVSRSGWR
jgi:hypothetical protein